jgi:hypothetical protein
LTSQNNQRSHNYSNNESLPVERHDSITSGLPIGQHLQDRIPSLKESRFSNNNYVKSSNTNISLRRGKEDIIPIKQTIIEGIDPISCLYCDNYRTSIVFDLGMHLYNNHKMEVINLTIGKSDMEKRIDYAVEECKKRIASTYNK